MLSEHDVETRPAAAVTTSRRKVLELWLYPLLAVTLVIGWQTATVHVNYGGNWTALFCIGSRFPVPPQLTHEHAYVFPDSPGFDGQFYHLIAHDPVFSQGFSRYIDAPEYRYRRILVPALAFLFAGGDSRRVDWAYLVVCWMFIAMGTSWACRFAHMHQRPLWLGLLFLCLPAVLASIDRLVVDVALSALTVGFALYAARGPSWELYLILAVAALSRETGFLLLGGYGVSSALRGRWGAVLRCAVAALPALGWYGFVHANAEAFHPTEILAVVPFRHLIDAVMHPAIPSSANTLVRWLAGAAEALVLAGTLGSMMITAAWVIRRKHSPSAMIAAVFVLLCLLLGTSGPSDLFAHVFNYARIFTPLYLLLALQAVASGRVLFALPLACVAPRAAMQFGMQVLAIGQRLLG